MDRPAHIGPREGDEREQPAYTLAEAAHHLHLPVATLRSWALGRGYRTAAGNSQFPPLIKPASDKPARLSFSNLIEAHVLRSLRTDHGVSVKEVRQALEFAEASLGIDRLLLRQELCTAAGRIFVERYGELIELSASGQLAMLEILQSHLKRVEWDSSRLPARFYPFPPYVGAADDRQIVIDARLAFGRPILARKGISTWSIAQRLDAGESVDAVAADYELEPSEIVQAAIYERAA